MDWILFLLYTGIILYATYSFYNWVHSLNPFDITKK